LSLSISDDLDDGFVFALLDIAAILEENVTLERLFLSYAR
jgi:hypothetical protein